MPTAFCPHCDEVVEVTFEDVGIGSYEFWGAKGTDVRWVPICSKCQEELDVDITPEQAREYPDYFPEDDWRENR
ncbi:MAG: hypothetical protein WC479_07325 [Candidatus Izemoplasmatales bacterium]